MTETTTPEDVERNARLIAAAPDLLAACVALLDGLDDYVQGRGDQALLDAYGQASEAISKANQ